MSAFACFVNEEPSHLVSNVNSLSCVACFHLELKGILLRVVLNTVYRILISLKGCHKSRIRAVIICACDMESFRYVSVVFERF